MTGFPADRRVAGSGSLPGTERAGKDAGMGRQHPLPRHSDVHGGARVEFLVDALD